MAYKGKVITSIEDHFSRSTDFQGFLENPWESFWHRYHTPREHGRWVLQLVLLSFCSSCCSGLLQCRNSPCLCKDTDSCARITWSSWLPIHVTWVIRWLKCKPESLLKRQSRSEFNYYKYYFLLICCRFRYLVSLHSTFCLNCDINSLRCWSAQRDFGDIQWCSWPYLVGSPSSWQLQDNERTSAPRQNF